MKWIAFAAAIVLIAVLGLFVVPWNLDAQPRPSITATWTAPGDDGNVGTASQYDMRWHTTRPDTSSSTSWLAWWNAANVVSGLPAPLIAGTSQTHTIAPTGGFPEGFTYYVAIRTRDEAGNWSGISNVSWLTVTDQTPPTPIINLRLQ